MIQMKTVLVNSQLQKKALLVQSLCNLLKEKILIINTEQSRQIEYALGVEDYCVYDVLDVLGNVVDYKKSMIKIKEHKYILPSSIKPEKFAATKEDFENLIHKLDEFETVIFTQDVGICFDEEIMWGDCEKSNAEKYFQITDSKSKRKEGYLYIGKLEFDKSFEKTINTFTQNPIEKIKHIVDNYTNNTPEKIGLIDRILGR